MGFFVNKGSWLTIFLLVLSGTINAQRNITITGMVKDSLGNPLDMANVVAINQETKALDGFGITNDKGQYKINVKSNTTYSLKISYLGFQTKEILITTKESDVARDFTLLEQAENLDEVEVTYEMPVTIKGDTIVYNTDSFVNGTEKKLEDVLKKLPGVEINDDGQIEVEGKQVSKVMVEGKDFFDGDSKLASKNIPADALDKVEVLRNFSEVSQLRGVTDNQDNVALNIKLKEGKKNFWFGEISAGFGADERYLAHPKLFYYNPKYSINIITDMNNIGEVPLSRRDYFNFTGGFRGTNRNSGTSFNVGSGDMGFLTMRNNRAKEVTSKFAAANFSYAPLKTWDLSGFAIFSGNRTDLQENSSRKYVQSDTGTQTPPDETTESKTHQKGDMGLFKFSSSYKPNANNHFDYDIFGRLSKQSQNQDFYSSVLQNIDEVQDQDPYSINQNLNYYYTLNNKNIFALSAQYLWQDEDPFYNASLAQSEQFKFSDVLGLDQNQAGYSVAQDKRIKTNKLDAKLDYWYVLTPKSNINFTFGTLFSKQQFNSEIYQILDNGGKFPLDNAQSDVKNDIRYNFTDLYLGLHYMAKVGIFTFTPGVTTHKYTTDNQQFGVVTKMDFGRLLPDFNTRIDLKKSENINFNYSMQTSFTDVNQLAEALVFNNYNSLFQGNRDLENALSHNLSLRYFSFNMFNFTNINASINYNKRIDQIRSQSEFLTIPNPDYPANSNEEFIQTTNRISSPFNSNFADESLSANGNFQKTFWKFKGSIGGSFSYSKFNQFVNNERSINKSFTQSYRTRLSTNFREAPNVEVGYNLSINNYGQGGNTTKYYTHSPIVNVSAYFLKGFIFETNYSYYNYSNQEKTLNNYSFLDANLSYQKKDTKWEYSVGVTNLLNTESLNQDNTNALYTSTSEYFIQPRYVMFNLKYEL